MNSSSSLTIGSLIAAAAALSQPAYAYNDRTEWAGYWTPAIPMASTQDFIDNFNWRGFGFDIDRRMSDNLSLAFSFRWTYFRQDTDNATFTVDSVTATGQVFRSLDAIPLLIHGRYHFLTEGPVRAFAGLGIGPSWGSRQLALGPIQQNDTGWQFVFAPEIGASFELSGRTTGIFFGIRYDAGLGTDAIPETSYLSFALGVSSRT